MRVTELKEGWTLYRVEPNFPYYRPYLQSFKPVQARVPGSVISNLVQGGVIPDPFLRRYETSVQWVSDSDWVYKCSFTFKKDSALPNAVLRFEGLDTFAEVVLNGETIGKSENFFVPLEIDVSNLLQAGENSLEVRLFSPVRVGVERRAEYFAKNNLPEDLVYFDERAFVRKPGYMFGWDWGPRLPDLGIWQPVKLLQFQTRISNLNIEVREGDSEKFEVLASGEGGEISFELFGPEGDLLGSQVGSSARFQVENPRLWWPNGHGEQPLYTLKASLNRQELVRRIGLRTAKLLREKDAIGESFEFEVNGRKVWACGANWIPNDSFPARITREDLRKQLTRYKSLNFNMLRVWGGGLYESDDFYDLCDELGIMVWQDFPYACMYYPDDEEAQRIAYKEARVNIQRLKHHASLVLWCGNNENLLMFQGKWSGPGTQVERYHGEHIYEGALRRALADEGIPEERYIPSSPIGTPEGGSDPNCFDYGDCHYWEVWHGKGDWAAYRDCRARFSSEFGFASSCSLALWKEVLGSEDWEPFPTAAVHHHDRTGKPWETFYGYVALHYREPKRLRDWVYASQLNQRDALRCGIETLRRSDYCRGSLIWQINDCWPVMSWSVEDYKRLLKPAGFELGRLYSPVMVALDFLVGFEKLGVWICNALPQEQQVQVEVVAVDTVSGELLKRWEQMEAVSADHSRECLSLDVREFEANRTAIRVRLNGDSETDRWQFLAEPKEMVFGDFKLVREQSEDQLKLSVKGFVPELVVWDEEDSEAVFDLKTGASGWRALTLWNESVTFGGRGTAENLLVLHLNAESPIRLS